MARRPEVHMKVKFDLVSVLLAIVLIATLLAFFAGIFPYPYGWIVITLFLVFRLASIRERE